MFSQHLGKDNSCVITDAFQNQTALSAASPTLTSGWHCVLKHLVELAEVHDHRELVWLHHRRHLLASHAGRDAKFPLRHVKTQLVVLLVIPLVQGVKVTESKETKCENEMGRDRRGDRNSKDKGRAEVGKLLIKQ